MMIARLAVGLLLLSVAASADSFDDQLGDVSQSISAQTQAMRQKMAAQAAAAAARPPGPILPQGTPKKYLVPFEDGWNTMMHALKGKDCRKFFAGRGFTYDQVVQTLDKTSYYFDKLPQGEGVGAQTSSESLVFINTEGIFMNPPETGKIILNHHGYTVSGGSNVRAMILLHELGHQLKIFGADYGSAELDQQNAEHSLAVGQPCLYLRPTFD